MASKQGIKTAFLTLWSNGCRGGPGRNERDEIRAASATWLHAFRRLTDEQLQAAVLSHLQDPESCQWWPQPGLLLSRIPQGTAIMPAAEAWTRLLRYVASRGRGNEPRVYRPEELQDAAIRRGVEAAGGWRYLCDCSVEQTEWARRRFLDAYQGAEHEAVTAPERLLETRRAALGIPAARSVLQLAGGHDAD